MVVIKTITYTVFDDAEGQIFINDVRRVIEVGGAQLKEQNRDKLKEISFSTFSTAEEELKEIQKNY